MVVVSSPTHITWVQSSTFPAVLECARFARGFVMHRASPVARRASATRSHVETENLGELLKQRQPHRIGERLSNAVDLFRFPAFLSFITSLQVIHAIGAR